MNEHKEMREQEETGGNRKEQEKTGGNMNE